MREQANKRRAATGREAIALHPDYPGGIDSETAAADMIANILHAQIGPHHEDAKGWGEMLADRAVRSWIGDDEDDGR